MRTFAFAPPGPAGRALTAATDGELLARLARGEREAAAELYRRHAATVYRHAWLITGAEGAAADAVHDTFVALLDRAGGYDPARGSCAAWLCGIARHLALRQWDPRCTAVEDIDAVAERAACTARDDAALPPLPEDAIERRAALDRLHAAIRALPPHYRDVLVLVELQQFSYADAAALAGIELGTVRSRLSRARALLAAQLREPSAAADATDGRSIR